MQIESAGTTPLLNLLPPILHYLEMITDILDNIAVAQLQQILTCASTAVITCHLSPDGDAMGSSLGLCRALRNRGINARVVVPDTPPRHLMFLPGAEHIVIFSRNQVLASSLLAKADVVFSLDYNEPKRIDLMESALMASKGVKVMIDHHLHPSNFPQIVISHPEESSTSIIIYRILLALGWSDAIDTKVGECLYTGMMTDTGNFSYNSDSPDIYLVIADLVRRGVNKDAIYRSVYYTASANRLRLNGYAMLEKLEIFPEHRAALISLTRDELNRFHYQKGDTEDLVNRPLTIAEIVYSIFLREESGYVKVSTRSKGEFPVNRFCKEIFNGGGHLNAAGGEFYGTMEQAIEIIKKAMPLYNQYLPKPSSTKAKD